MERIMNIKYVILGVGIAITGLALAPSIFPFNLPIAIFGGVLVGLNIGR